jgi:hypothetical protein
VILLAACLLAFVQAGRARERAVADAARRARLTAQTKLAPLLGEGDLGSPITGSRYDQVASAVRRTILGHTHVKNVTIWSEVGRVLFAQDDGLVGTRPTYIRDLVYSVANGTTQTTIETGALKTFTPIWRQPGGTVVVAELDQPFGPIAGTAGRIPTLAGVLLGLGSAACLVLFAMTWRPAGASASARSQVAQGAPLRRPAGATGAQALGPVMAAGSPAPPAPPKRAPAAAQAGLREAEAARTEAEERARAAEERLKKLQLQHKQAMERLQALEARLSVAAAAPKQTQEELRALRDQVRESAERLHTAERENETLRARLGTPHLPGVVTGGNAR